MFMRNMGLRSMCFKSPSGVTRTESLFRRGADARAGSGSWEDSRFSKRDWFLKLSKAKSARFIPDCGRKAEAMPNGFGKGALNLSASMLVFLFFFCTFVVPIDR